MNYESVRETIDEIKKEFDELIQEAEELKREIAAKYKQMLPQEKKFESVGKQVAKIFESVADEMTFEEKCVLLDKIKGDLSSLVEQRKQIKSPLTSNVSKVDAQFKPITNALTGISKDIQEEIIKELKANPKKASDEVFTNAESFSIEDKGVKRVYHATNIAKISPEFLMIDQASVEEYYRTYGEMPKGIKATVERLFVIKDKKPVD